MQSILSPPHRFFLPDLSATQSIALISQFIPRASLNTTNERRQQKLLHYRHLHSAHKPTSGLLKDVNEDSESWPNGSTSENEAAPDVAGVRDNGNKGNSKVKAPTALLSREFLCHVTGVANAAIARQTPQQQQKHQQQARAELSPVKKKGRYEDY